MIRRIWKIATSVVMVGLLLGLTAGVGSAKTIGGHREGFRNPGRFGAAAHLSHAHEHAAGSHLVSGNHPRQHAFRAGGPSSHAGAHNFQRPSHLSQFHHPGAHKLARPSRLVGLHHPGAHKFARPLHVAHLHSGAHPTHGRGSHPFDRPLPAHGREKPKHTGRSSH
jgi:hypothetical protein